MTNMDHIIHLGTRPNCVIVRIPTIDGTAGAYLYTIFDQYPSAAFHTLIPLRTILFGIIIKSITTNYGTRLDHYIIRECTIIQDGYLGMDAAIIPATNIFTNERSGCYIGIVNYHCRWIDGLSGGYKRSKMTYNSLIRLKGLLHDQ